MPDAAVWLGRHGWPGWEPLECPVEGAACLGWAVYVANGSAACMVPSTHREWADGWAKDTELIFEMNNEFTRYHRGEDFGGSRWFEDKTIRIEGQPDDSPRVNDRGQGELF